ncbi:hypothetical protein BDZ88DRAFT_416689 [Geranomyces variabilis]|nr:hypothetical protein BDZ88DRAFT_416689 [Geranomyces variabilis]
MGPVSCDPPSPRAWSRCQNPSNSANRRADYRPELGGAKVPLPTRARPKACRSRASLSAKHQVSIEIVFSSAPFRERAQLPRFAREGKIHFPNSSQRSGVGLRQDEREEEFEGTHLPASISFDIHHVPPSSPLGASRHLLEYWSSAAVNEWTADGFADVWIRRNPFDTPDSLKRALLADLGHLTNGLPGAANKKAIDLMIKHLKDSKGKHYEALYTFVADSLPTREFLWHKELQTLPAERLWRKARSALRRRSKLRPMLSEEIDSEEWELEPQMCTPPVKKQKTPVEQHGWAVTAICTVYVHLIHLLQSWLFSGKDIAKLFHEYQTLAQSQALLSFETNASEIL